MLIRNRPIFHTLFDSHYLSRGLALYESIIKRCPDATLYIFALDDLTYNYLISQNLKNTIIISLEEFEDSSLIEVRPQRTKAEYCWTCTPSTFVYLFKTYNIPHTTYLDADLYFYRSPMPLYKELQNKTALITSHFYTPCHDQSELYGKYCVQYLSIFNNDLGQKIVENWRHQCLEWCFDRAEDGKFGDQKYLDNWPDLYGDQVAICEHRGAGVAAWNTQQYHWSLHPNGPMARIKGQNEKFPLIFYHFHALKFYQEKDPRVDFGDYLLDKSVRQEIYRPYLQHLLQIQTRLDRVEELAGKHFSKHPTRFKSDWHYNLYQMKKMIKGMKYNYPLTKFEPTN